MALSRLSAFMFCAIFVGCNELQLVFVDGWKDTIMAMLTEVIKYLTLYSSFPLSSTYQPTKQMHAAAFELVSEDGGGISTGEDEDIDVDTDTHLPTTRAIRRQRLYYLDNLKSMLILIVVVHHTMSAFTGTALPITLSSDGDFSIASFFLEANRDYFMSTFFFISAYFTPRSCDKLGKLLFIRQKAFRLGWPYLIFWYLLGPIFILIIQSAFGYDSSSTSWPLYGGPMWFLAALLLFNIFYLLIDSNIPYLKMKLPSLWLLLLCCWIFPHYRLFLPNGLGARAAMGGTGIPFYVASMCFGVIAYYNAWLEKIKEYHVIFIRCLFCFGFFVQIAVMVIETKGYWKQDVVHIISIGIFGLTYPVFTLFLLQSFAIFLDFSNDFLSMASRCSYMVYFIHYFVLTPVVWSFVKIMEAVSETKIIFNTPNDGIKWNADTNFGNEWYMALGVCYTLALGVPLCWLFAWLLLKIPCIGKVL